MKTRLNLFSILIIVVLAMSVVHASYYFFAGVKAGISSAATDAETASDPEMAEKLSRMKVVQVMPDLMHPDRLLRDSVYNAKTQSYVPASYSQLFVSTHTEPSLAQAIVTGIASFVMMGCYLWAIYLFVRLILAVNRQDIFQWRNVRRLRRLGIALSVCYGCTLGIAYLTYQEVKEAFALPGYSLELGEATEVTTLVLGLCALLVAEVFAIGLKMKEEQDLTI